jgi:phosphoglycerate dehydrogenase-like enzyme
MNDKPNVIVDPHFRCMTEIFKPGDLTRLHEMVNVIWGADEPMPVDEFERHVPDAQAVICADWRYGHDALMRATRLRAILTVSGGFPRSLDYAYCFAKGIRVLSAAPAFARSVAEMALAMTLSASRDVAAGDRAMRAGREAWLHAGNRETFMLYNKPVGFIGYGSIGRALRPLITPFGCPITAYDPGLTDGYLRSQGITPQPLDELLASSKVIYVLAAPSADNQALLSRQRLALIQPGSVLILISRAYVVDFDALTEMVAAGKFKAAIDVFPTEPLEADHPIRHAEYALLSAHRAGPTQEGCWEIGQMVLDDLDAVVRGLPPQLMQNAQPELISRYLSNTIRQRT